MSPLGSFTSQVLLWIMAVLLFPPILIADVVLITLQRGVRMHARRAELVAIGAGAVTLVAELIISATFFYSELNKFRVGFSSNSSSSISAGFIGLPNQLVPIQPIIIADFHVVLTLSWRSAAFVAVQISVLFIQLIAVVAICFFGWCATHPLVVTIAVVVMIAIRATQ